MKLSKIAEIYEKTFRQKLLGDPIYIISSRQNKGYILHWRISSERLDQ